MKLASRFSRLLAVVIDGMVLSFVMGLAMLPLLIFKIDISVSIWWYQLLSAILGVVIFYFINKKSLIEEGQTLGKSVVKIKITTLDYELPTASMLKKRYLTFFLPSYIPVIGRWLLLINVVSIFTKEQRCLHDLVSGTVVVCEEG